MLIGRNLLKIMVKIIKVRLDPLNHCKKRQNSFEKPWQRQKSMTLLEDMEKVHRFCRRTNEGRFRLLFIGYYNDSWFIWKWPKQSIHIAQTNSSFFTSSNFIAILSHIHNEIAWISLNAHIFPVTNKHKFIVNSA